MGYGNPGFMNQFDGSSMGSMMGYQQSPNMHTMRGPQNMGAPPQWGADPMNMGFGGGPRFNNQMDQFGGFNGYSGMSNQSFGKYHFRKIWLFADFSQLQKAEEADPYI